MYSDLQKTDSYVPYKDCFIIIFLSFVIFIFFTQSWFHGDDFIHLYRLSGETGNPYINALAGHIYGMGQDHNYRPLTNIIFALLTEVGSPFIFRLFTLSLHLACGTIIWLILRQLSFNRFAVFFATLLFLFNPSINTTVFWISAIGDLLTTLFSLLAFYLFLRHPGGTINKTTFLIAFFYVLGMLSKEMCITLPALLFIISIFCKRLKKDLYTIFFIALTGFIYFIIRGVLLGSFLAGSETTHYFSIGQDTIVSVIKYIFSSIIPFPPHWLWRQPALLLIGGVHITVIIFFIHRKGFKEGIKSLSLMGIFYLVSLLPVVNAYAGWYLYFVNIGLSIFIGLILSELNQSLVRRGAVVYTILCISIMLYWGTCYMKAGTYEQKFLKELSKIEEKNVAILGLPGTAFSSVPLIPFSSHVEAALKYFYNEEKQITLATQATVENLLITPQIHKIRPHQFRLELNDDGYNFFTSRNKAEGRGWKKIIEVNSLGKPTIIEIGLPPHLPVYYYNSNQLIKLDFGQKNENSLFLWLDNLLI